LTVAHAERAPQLLQFLRQYRVHVRAVQVDRAAARALVERSHGPLLYVPRDFGTRLAAGKPASLRLYADESERALQGRVQRLASLIGLYAGTIARLRLVARGLDPQLLTPIALHTIDISTPQSRAALVLGMLSYAILLTMLMSGLYIAIDATAGERERGSLEPLLTMPVRREHLVYGKMLAACTMMTVCLVLTVAAFAFALHHIGLDRLGMSANFGPAVAAGIVLGCLPLIPTGAALMTLVAAYTRSYREAQTYVGLVLLIPTLPLIFANIMGLRPRPALMAVPSLSQHFIIMSLLRAEPLPVLDLVISAGVTLALGAVLMFFAGRLYRREKLLG
ncbi:MAG: ABC transporter permease, partial [Steroidobacteraceae bacterium]